MISLQRKLALRAQASLAHGTERSLAALARTTQAAHSTVAVGDSDVPLVDTVQDARDSAELLPFLEDGTSLAGDDAWEAWDQSEFAVDLAHQLEGELATARADLDTALREAADALEASGLAQSDAANAVTHAAEAANAAAQAVQDALAAHQVAEGAAPSWNTANPVASDASGKPIGAVWYVRNTAGRVIRMWELTALGWVHRPFDETVIPQLAIGSGTYGTLAGDRLVANSVTAAQIQALAITATEIASNAITAVKIAANAVTAAKISAGAVTTAKLDALAVTAEKIAVGAIIADKIAAGAITTGKLAATAIDGMLITGAKIRTAPAGQRFELTEVGLQAYNTENQQTMRLAPGGDGLVMRDPDGGLMSFGVTGGLRLSGSQARDNARFLMTPTHFSIGSDEWVAGQEFRVGFSRSGSLPVKAGVVIESRNSDIDMYSAENMTLRSRVEGDNSWINLDFGELRTRRVKAYGAEVVDLYANTIRFWPRSADDSRQPTILGTGAGAIRIRPTQEPTMMPIYLDGPVVFQGDTDWTRLDGWTGGFAHSTSPVQYRRRGGYVEFKGMLMNSSWSGGLTPFGATMPTGFRPSQNESFTVTSDFPGTRIAEFGANGSIRLYGSGAAPAWWSFTMVRFPIDS